MRRQSTFISIATLFVAIIGCESETLINYPEGGYDYPTNVEDTNYYRYPIDSMLYSKDSFYIPDIYITAQIFGEPNLSLKPVGQDVFRLHYDGWKNVPASITLTKNKITVHRGNQFYYYKKDTSRLNEIERLHYNVLTRYYPLQKNRSLTSKQEQKYLDSLTRVYPQLLKPGYYKYLVEKTVSQDDPPFKYTITEKSISYAQFYHIVSLINASGYWKMPYNLPVTQEMSDGEGYALEANTANKYNFVSGGPGATTEAFAKACQAIVKLAGLDEKTVGRNDGIQLCENSDDL
jgi:hypothetical protein